MENLLSAGFGTLEQLKARVLPAVMESYDADGEWDEDLKQIGLATAAMFNGFCNRVLQRGVEVAYDEEGGMRSIVLDRYPLESVSALQLRSGGGTTDVLERIWVEKPKSGILELNGYLGCYRDRVTCTYTGGYWLGTTETSFESVTVAVPAGATQVSVTVPDGFTAAEAVSAVVERLAGDGQLVMANMDTSGAAVVVTFTGAAVVADAFQVVVRFENPPDAEKPAGATQLPSDLFEAWVMQSQAAMEHLNTLRGAGVQRSGETVGQLSELAMLPVVRQILTPYKRFK